jgi:hypothetical protein
MSKKARGERAVGVAQLVEHLPLQRVQTPIPPKRKK